MKLRNLVVLGFFCLFLGGCTTTGGPIGSVPSLGSVFNKGSTPPNRTPSNNGSNSPTALPPKRKEDDTDSQSANSATSGDGKEPATSQTDAQRACTGDARDCLPTDNSSCTSSGSGGKCCDFPGWLNEAMKFYGIYEGGFGQPGHSDVRGKPGYLADGQNPQVLEFFDHANWSLAKRGRKTWNESWCGAFVHWCLTKTLNPRDINPETKTANYYHGQNDTAVNALGWAGNKGYNVVKIIESYGETVELNKPFMGVIAVIQNVKKRAARAFSLQFGSYPHDLK